MHPSRDETIIQLSSGLAVRRYRSSDAEVAAKHLNNVNISKYMTDRFPYPYTLEKSREYIATCSDPSNWQLTGPGPSKPSESGRQPSPDELRVPISWVITLNDEMIGGLGLRFLDDVHQRSANLGYWMAEDMSGRGYVSQVVPPFIDWAWTVFEFLIRLEGRVYADNLASQRVLIKSGFVHEGTSRAGVWKNGKIKDLELFGLLRPGLQY